MPTGPTLHQLLKLVRRMLEAGQPPELQQELEHTLARLEALRPSTVPSDSPWTPPPDATLTPEQIACCDEHWQVPATVRVEKIEKEEMAGEFFITCAIAVTHPCGLHRSEVKLLALGGPSSARRMEPKVRLPAHRIEGGWRHELFRFDVPPNPGPEDVVLQVEATTLCGHSITESIYPYKF